MVDTAKLRGIIAERGMTRRQVASKLKMSEKTFYRKMQTGVFGTDEAMAITELLDIKNPAEIFLVKE